MSGIPEGLVVQANSFVAVGGQSDVMKPVYGNLGPLPTEFRIAEEYVASDSEYLGVEVTRKKVVALIHSDRFSKVPLAVEADNGEMRDREGNVVLDHRGKVVRKRIRSELSPSQARALAPLYERFKNQKDSTDTKIVDWQAAREDEKEFLASLGIWTVEQLREIPEHDRYKLGPDGNELWGRADRHFLSKESKKREAATEEMLAVLEANKAMKQQNDALQEQMYAMQAQIAEMAGKPSKQSKSEKTVNFDGE